MPETGLKVLLFSKCSAALLAGRFLGLIVCLGLCGCVETSLDLGQVPPAAYKLAALAQRDIYLDVRTSSGLSSQNVTAGHQYLLLLLPFGRISASKPAEDLFVTAAWLLGERGYRANKVALQDQPDAKSMRTLRISLEDLSASGYDFLFVRKVSCSADLQGTLSLPKDTRPREALANGTSAEYRRYAFKQELEYHCGQALELALRELFDYLQL